MRISDNQAVITRLNGSKFHRVIVGARMHNNCYMGFVKIEGKYERVFLNGFDWYEHPTDWRCYDTITEARRYDSLYDIKWPDEPLEYVQGIGVM